MRFMHAISQESIDFQSPIFFKELTNTFQEVKGLKKEAINESEGIGRLGAIVKHHTGLTVVFNIGDIDPSVNIPQVDRNHPLVNYFVRNYISSADGLAMINNAEGLVRGTVNLRTGKVSGIFADLSHTINMPAKMLGETKYTAEECAAIVLHEIGHLLSYYEYITRSVTTNQVLAGVSKALDGSGTIEQREAILLNAKKALRLKELDVKNLSKTTNNKVAEMVVVSSVVKETKSELGSNIYDLSSWEMLADQYVARHQASRHLVTALDKLYRGMWNISFRSLPSYIALEALKLAMLFLAPGIGVILVILDGSGDGTYDVPGARFKRVRNQVVEALKNTKLAKEDKARLEADLVTIDDVLAKVEDRRQVLGVLADFIFPSNRRGIDQTRLQQDLEGLAANDLFVKAAQLKELA